MKILITPQFNKAMQSLDGDSQSEVKAFYAFVSGTTKEHVVSSSFTKIVSENDDIFTLRGNRIRIFCTFSQEGEQEAIVFLDVKSVKLASESTQKYLQGEITLFSSKGEPIAYIEDNEDKTIFSFNGEPLAYIDNADNIYGYNGKHLGWFEEQIVWNHSGKRIGFTKKTCPVFTQFEPFKGFKQFKPFKAFQQFAPFKPFKTYIISEENLLDFLRKGRY